MKFAAEMLMYKIFVSLLVFEKMAIKIKTYNSISETNYRQFSLLFCDYLKE